MDEEHFGNAQPSEDMHEIEAVQEESEVEDLGDTERYFEDFGPFVANHREQENDGNSTEELSVDGNDSSVRRRVYYLPKNPYDSDSSVEVISAPEIPAFYIDYDHQSREILIEFSKKECTPYQRSFTCPRLLNSNQTSVRVNINIGTNKSESEKNDKSSNKSSTRVITLACQICKRNNEEVLAAGDTLMSTFCGHLFCNVCIEKNCECKEKCIKCGKVVTKEEYHNIYF